MKRDLAARGFGPYNVWLYPSFRLEALDAPLFRDVLPERLPRFVSSGSLKDDSAASAPPGGATLSVTTLVPFALFERWAGERAGERSADYRAAKRALRARVLRELDE